MPKKAKKPTKEQMERMELMAADLPGLMEYATNVGGFSIVPTNEGVIKGKALDAMHQQTQSHLDQIKEQMLLLARQAQDLKDRVDISHEIYQAKITFSPVIGKTYYLYEKKGGARLLSLIAPEEWGAMSGMNTIAEVKLLADHTWEIVRKPETEDI
jgi:predicted transcriptional regulator